MQLVSFEHDGRFSFGLADGERVREASAEFRERFRDLRAVIAAGAEQELADDAGGAIYSASEFRFVAVIPNPDKILCVGVNYRPHIEEMGREVPDHPVVLTTHSTTSRATAVSWTARYAIGNGTRRSSHRARIFITVVRWARA